jgi:hypothetical protein
MVKSTVVDSSTGQSMDSRYAYVQNLNLLRDQVAPEPEVPHHLDDINRTVIWVFHNYKVQ